MMQKMKEYIPSCDYNSPFLLLRCLSRSRSLLLPRTFLLFLLFLLTLLPESLKLYELNMALMVGSASPYMPMAPWEYRELLGRAGSPDNWRPLRSAEDILGPRWALIRSRCEFTLSWSEEQFHRRCRNWNWHSSMALTAPRRTESMKPGFLLQNLTWNKSDDLVSLPYFLDWFFMHLKFSAESALSE